MCSYWSLYSISLVVTQCFDKISLNAWRQKKKKRTLPVFADWLWVGNFLNSWPGHLQLCLFLLAQSLKVSQRRQLRFFWGLFWVFIQLWECVWSYGSPRKSPHLPSSIYLLPDLFFPRLFSLSIVCPDCCPLPQSPVAKTFAFKCFWQMPGKLLQSWECSLSKTKVGSCTGPLWSHQRSWNTQPQFFETNIFLLSLPLATHTRSACYHLHGHCCSGKWGRAEGQSKMPQCSYHSPAASFTIKFSLVIGNFCLDYRVVQKVIVTIFAGLLVTFIISWILFNFFYCGKTYIT